METIAEYESSSPFLKWIKILAFLAFLGLIGFLVYSSPFGSGITGDLINNIPFVGDSEDVEMPGDVLTFTVETDLDNAPNLNLEGNFEKIELTGTSEGSFSAGGQKFNLKNLNNYIVLLNYTGDFEIVNETLLIKGRARQVSVNGIEMDVGEGELIKVSTEDFGFDSVEAYKTPKIRKIDFLTSGEILIDSESSVTLENDELILKSFKGDLLFDSSKNVLRGTVSSVEIIGERKIVFE